MTYNLKDEDTKNYVIQLSNDGLSSYKISDLTDINPRTIQRFLAKESHKEWWDKHEVGNYLDEMSELPKANISKGEIKPINLPPRTKSNSKIYDAFLSAIKTVTGEGLKIIVVADTQCKPDEELSYMSWIGKYINDKKPDVVVHIGDHFDCPSLSSYDKGERSFEGRRLKADLEAGTKGLQLLLDELDSDYTPRLVFCLGNHEERIDRLANDMPELEGFVGTDLLPLEEMGWEVIPFLKPVEIAGIFFVHYLANPMTGKPYSGTAMNQLKTVGRSFVVGHKQCLDVAIRPTIDGKHQLGIINGACYPFDEGYKGYQGNNHWRGITVLHEAKDGFASPMFVSLDYLKKKYD